MVYGRGARNVRLAPRLSPLVMLRLALGPVRDVPGEHAVERARVRPLERLRLAVAEPPIDERDVDEAVDDDVVHLLPQVAVLLRVHLDLGLLEELVELRVVELGE